MKTPKQINEVIDTLQGYGMGIRRSPQEFSFGNYEECRRLLKTVMLQVDDTIKSDNFVWLPQYEQIAWWMSNTRGKGLLLRGSCGTGKTIIVSHVIPVLFKMYYDKSVIPYSANDINKLSDEILERWCYCIDDVGVEGVKNAFGEKYMVFSVLMDKAQQSMKPVFLTTNLTAMDISERYGKRVLDRIVQLCNIVKFETTKKVIEEKDGKMVEVIKRIDLKSLRK